MSLQPFPNIAPPSFPLEEDWEDVGISAGFEDGIEQSRARFTRSRGKWTLNWTAMTEEDYQALMLFWRETVKGKSASFNWTHPMTGETYEVRFIAKSSFKQIAPRIWSGDCSIGQV